MFTLGRLTLSLEITGVMGPQHNLAFTLSSIQINK